MLKHNSKKLFQKKYVVNIEEDLTKKKLKILHPEFF